MIRRFQIQNNSLIDSESEDSPVQVYINPDSVERDKLLRTYNIDEHTLTLRWTWMRSPEWNLVPSKLF